MKKRAVTLFLAAFLAAGTIFSPLSSLEVQAASWKKNSTGWWWEEDDKSWPANEWKTINGKTYNFDQKGYMRSGWYWDGKNWYYLGKANDGSMKTGWQKVNGKWYYMNSDGKMATGWKKVNGTWYYLESSGAMHSGWLWDGSNWYLLGGADDGSMKTGWQKVNGVWYYMYQNGAMAANTWIGNYYVNNSGAWVQNAKPAQWIASGGRWWYRHTDGGYTTNNFETINGKVYYFDAAGWMVTGWKQVNGKWYYFDNSGAMTKNAWIGDYYVGNDGVMAVSTWIGDKYVDGSGKWDKNKQKEEEKAEEKPEEEPAVVPVEWISLNHGDLRRFIGTEEDITLSCYPANATLDKLEAPKWSSSDPNVLTVDQNGHVKAVGVGTAQIFVQIGDVIGHTGDISVAPLMESFYYEWGDQLTVSELGFVTDLARVLITVPEDVNLYHDWTFESSDETVATLNGGSLVALKPGTCTITAGVNGKTVSFTFTVTGDASTE